MNQPTDNAGLPQAVALSLFASRMAAICDEMAGALKLSAFSPNIKEREDFSCAVFDGRGELCAQAAHIPVHLGSMAYAMGGIVAGRDWRPGDQVMVNDPYLGGTHLPDVSLIAPVFVDDKLQGFVANRAHHADIGAEEPGSMPLSRSLDEEGMVIPPTHLARGGEVCREVLDSIARRTRNPAGAQGDLNAQLSANITGVRRLEALIRGLGAGAYRRQLDALNDYAAQLARQSIAEIPDGDYAFTDYLDGDGLGNDDLAVAVSIIVRGDEAHVDFTGTANQTRGNLNCPISVAAAGVYYVFRCLMPEQTPACQGMMRPVTLHAPEGCLLNARRPACRMGNHGCSSTSCRTLLPSSRSTSRQSICAYAGASGPSTASTISAWSSSLPRTYRYSDIVPAPISTTPSAAPFPLPALVSRVRGSLPNLVI